MAVLNQLKKSAIKIGDIKLAINSDQKTSRITSERCNAILNYMKDGSDHTLSKIATVSVAFTLRRNPDLIMP